MGKRQCHLGNRGPEEQVWVGSCGVQFEMNLRCGSTWDMEMDMPSACLQTKKGLKAEARVETEIS